MTWDLERMHAEERAARLTAFALGEGHPEERASVAAYLERHPEAARDVEEVRAVARDLERRFAAEMDAAPGLTADQRAILEGSGQPAIAVRRRRWPAFLAAAALLGATFTTIELFVQPFGGGGGGKADAETARVDRSQVHAPQETQEEDSVVRALGYVAFSKRGAPVGNPSPRPDASRAERPIALRLPETTRPIAQDPTVRYARQPQDSLGSRVEFRNSAGAQRDGVAVEEVDDFGTEAYDRIVENAFRAVRDEPLSTFSIDVDTASYANVRRFLRQGQMPPPDAVRVEELVNYFTYEDPAPGGDEPFAVRLEMAQCPWNLAHRIVRVGFKSKDIPQEHRPPSNLVFLIDVSGSMNAEDKLPLLVRSLRLLVDQLGENDRVAIVVYAGASGLVLESTSCERKERIHQALEGLQAGGSTNGGAGIQLAYDQAVQHFIPGGTNRVILCTDGDFNVGVTDRGSLTRLIEEKRASGVFLSVLGFGRGNLKDAQMEQLADRGNGNYAYIDSLEEGRKVLVREMGATLLPVAKDVKLQVEFNPRVVHSFRLIGYENRVLAHQDFNDDAKDAGELGAGSSVTALYEIVPVGAQEGGPEAPGVDPLKYQTEREPSAQAAGDEALTVKVRYKQPDGDTSRLLTFPLAEANVAFDDASEDLRFASAVAAFGMLLRRSEHVGTATYRTVLELAQDAKGADPHGDRQGFLDLVARLIALQ